VWSLSFSPCGNYLASASDDKSIRIWARIKKPPLKPSANSFGGGGNYDSWECRSVMAGVHERSIYSISWGPGVGGGEGRHLGWLASTGGDGKINIWEISVRSSLFLSLSSLFCLLAETQVPESETPISTISSKLIATRSAAHGVADVNSIAWCPRTGFQDLLATTGDDAIVRVWKVASDVEEVD
jgi:WD40 repeat protein